MNKIQLAIFGCGFWSQYQTAAWMELKDFVDVVAVCDPDLQKAQSLAIKFAIPYYYNDPAIVFKQHKLDAVDIITDVDSHPLLVRMAIQHRISVICQKPMAATFAEAEAITEEARSAGVSFFVHENFRWQEPLRVLRRKLEEGRIGRPFKANIKFCSSFPVFENQPFLAELDQFILTDVGTHILDVARFLFGEARSLHCMTHRINPTIKGEDVANVFMEMQTGVHCYTEMSYASRWEHERFPETYVMIEGESGSLYLGPGFKLSTTDQSGTTTELIEISEYDWADPDYALIHSSVVACNQNLMYGLLGEQDVETSAEDNMKTLRLVFDAYRSAAERKIVYYDPV